MKSLFAIFLVVLLSLASWAPPAHGQALSAEAFFHEAARHYVDGSIGQAEAAVAEGLRLDPSHPKLRALQEKLQRERPAGSGSTEGDEEQDETEARSGEPAPGEDQSDEESDDDPSSAATPSASADEEDLEENPAAAPPPEAGTDRMSREQAERLLQALQLQELQLLREVLKRDRPMQAIEKDW